MTQREALLELICRASTDLPDDVELALRAARAREEPASTASSILGTILENVVLARQASTPLCQDTGTPLFYVATPPGVDQQALAGEIRAAVREATRRSFLRPNTVDPVTGRTVEDNVGPGLPSLHFRQWRESAVRVDLVLKGGGCENVGTQYSLPDSRLGAERDLEGVRRCLLDAVVKAQGQGCAPGILGAIIGGDRSAAYEASKELFLRRLDEVNPDPTLAALEEEIARKANDLGIGPMGLGGRTTVLGVKIGALHRLPASFFVTVSYMCWAFRRRTLLWRDGEGTFT